MRLMRDGSFRAADWASRKKLKAAGFRVDSEYVHYIYKVRDPVQWRRAHVLGELLAQNSDAFFGMEPHDVLKRLQIEENVACFDAVLEVTLLDEAGQPCGRATRTVREAESLEFGNVDQVEWEMIYGRLCKRAGHYFGGIDEEAVKEMARLMPEPV